MAWKSFNSKQQGLAGMGSAIEFFTALGLTVSLPLNDSQDYDLIVDYGQSLKRVQVKTTRHKTGSNYSVCLKSSGGTKGSVYATVGQGSSDLLYIATEAGDCYLMPTMLVKNHKHSLTLGVNVEQYKIKRDSALSAACKAEV